MDTSAPATVGAGRLLTAKEAAEYLNISVPLMNKWRSKGGGPKFIKLGANCRYHPDDLAAFIASRRCVRTGDK